MEMQTKHKPDHAGLTYENTRTEELPDRLLGRELEFYDHGNPVHVNGDATLFTGREKINEDVDDGGLYVEFTLKNGNRITTHKGIGNAPHFRYHTDDGMEAVSLIDVDVSTTEYYDAELADHFRDTIGELGAFRSTGIGKHHRGHLGTQTPNRFTVVEVVDVVRGKLVLESLPYDGSRVYVLPIIDNGNYTPHHDFAGVIDTDEVAVEHGEMYDVRSDGLYEYPENSRVADAEAWNKQGCIDTSEPFVPE